MFEKALSDKMGKVVKSFSRDLESLRTDIVTPSIVENIKVTAYSKVSPLKNMSAISNKDSRTLVVKPWDPDLIKTIAKAIDEANIGVTSNVNGSEILLSFPAMTGERREELVKMAKAMAEKAKVSIRNIRHDEINGIKRGEKSGSFPKDSVKRFSKKIQEITDDKIKSIDFILSLVIKKIETGSLNLCG